MMCVVPLHRVPDGRNVLMNDLVSALGMELEPLLAPFWEVPSRIVPRGAGAFTLTCL